WDPGIRDGDWVFPIFHDQFTDCGFQGLRLDSLGTVMGIAKEFCEILWILQIWGQRRGISEAIKVDCNISTGLGVVVSFGIEIRDYQIKEIRVNCGIFGMGIFGKLGSI
ncbi:hypothetical protein HID58_006599, partial [Brassica napus]